MKIVRWALGLVLSLFAAPALAGPPYVTDDSGTPELHHYELNVGYESDQVKGSETQRFPDFDLNYGYLNNVQLTLGFGGVSVRDSGKGRTAGFGDIAPEVKWRFQEETKRRPQLGLEYVLTIPTASRSRGLGSGSFDHTLMFIIQKSYGRSTLVGNLGGVLSGAADSRNNLVYNLFYSFQLTEKLVIGAELYGNTSEAVGQRDELAWGVGITYNFTPDRALLLKAGRSEHGLSDLNVYAGVQLLFK
jgi:hypothetical protein